MMDELRGALQIDRFANIKRHLDAGGALPDIIEHERIRLIVKPGDVEGFASALGRPIDGPDLKWRLGQDGTALHRTRSDFEACPERLVTESVHSGER
jgi:hypothetical protein